MQSNKRRTLPSEPWSRDKAYEKAMKPPVRRAVVYDENEPQRHVIRNAAQQAAYESGRREAKNLYANYMPYTQGRQRTAIPSVKKNAYYMETDDFLGLSPLAKKLLTILTLVAGFVIVYMIGERLYFIGYTIVALGLAVYWCKISHSFILKGLVLMLVIAASCFCVVRTVAITNADREAKLLAEDERYAQILQDAQEREAVAALAAVQTPTPDEIARGGKTHDGIPLKTPLYYHGATRYHVDPNCSYVNEKFRPMTEFILYEQMTERKYKNLQPCNSCGAPVRPHTH